MLVLMCYDNEMVKNSNYIHIYTNKLTKSILNDDQFLPNFFFLLLGKKWTWPIITHHGQNTVVKIPDTTEVIFNLFCSDNNALHFEYYLTWKAFRFSSSTVKQKLCRHHATIINLWIKNILNKHLDMLWKKEENLVSAFFIYCPLFVYMYQCYWKW